MADSVIEELRAIRELLRQLVVVQMTMLDALAEEEEREPGERDQTEAL